MTHTDAPPIPSGTGLVIDHGTRELAGGRLLGGTPRRMLRLSDGGREAWAELQGGRVRSLAAGRLARRLTDVGLAHPRPDVAEARDVTVVVPVRDRAGQLDRCLASLAAGDRVVVVDDGSADPAAIAAAVRRNGARLVRRDTSAGPAAARNIGLAGIDSELVAFVDSDCRVPTGWLDILAGHFVDSAVGAVAPRVRSARHDHSRRYRDQCGLLDLGPGAARVRPLGRVGYVPTAALVVRREALVEVGEFDADLRFGEDVDLVWRLDAAGWRVRYDPAVEVLHDEPIDWPARLVKRFRYGTAAAPLATRHPGASSHLVANPWPLGFVAAAAIARRPELAAAAAAGSYVATRRALSAVDVPEISAARLTGEALAGTWRGAGRYATQFTLPVLAAAALRRRSLGKAVAVATLVAAAPVAEYRARRPAVSLPRFVAGQIVDDAAYGAGVYAGCLRQRTALPLKVAVRRRGSER